MKKRDLLLLFLALIIAVFVLVLFIYFPKNENKFIINDIKVEISGKIKKKVAVRKDLFTHVLIARSNNSDTLIFLGNRIDSVNVGDNFLKYQNSPFFYVFRQDKKVKKFTYVSIPKAVLNDKNFPKEWKDSCKNNWKNAIID